MVSRPSTEPSDRSRLVACPPDMRPELWDGLSNEAFRRAVGREPAHDFSHVVRVVRLSRTICLAEGIAQAEGMTAALLHELFTLPKGHPESHLAGDRCALHATSLLHDLGADAPFAERVARAIAEHAFSKGVRPTDVVGRVLQDADRLDALGAVGLARMWATCADMKRPLFAPIDAFCTHREPDDKKWGLDHVFRKLLRLPDLLHFETSKHLAKPRVALIERYLEALCDELQEEHQVQPGQGA